MTEESDLRIQQLLDFIGGCQDRRKQEDSNEKVLMDEETIAKWIITVNLSVEI
jgi:hypothetical protein